MKYIKIKPSEFNKQIDTEEKARNLVWKTKFDGKEFVCTKCGHEKFWEYHTEPEIRKCKSCAKHVRLRKGTLFENSKISMLIWIRALHIVMNSKRGVSALELQRHLGMNSYGTVWSILHKIRRALQSRDNQYKLKDVIELDGAEFGKKNNSRQVLIAVETKSFVNEKGQQKSRAGFAQVVVAQENRMEAQQFVDKTIAKGSMVNTDGSYSFQRLENIDHDYQIIDGNAAKVNCWLPWVHKFISNSKRWILGTHHGIERKYLDLYLAEYTYRFNRRHDPDGLFHRALTACVLSRPHTYGSLFG